MSTVKLSSRLANKRRKTKVVKLLSSIMLITTDAMKNKLSFPLDKPQSSILLSIHIINHFVSVCAKVSNTYNLQLQCKN